MPQKRNTRKDKKKESKKYPYKKGGRARNRESPNSKKKPKKDKSK